MTARRKPSTVLAALAVVLACALVACSNGASRGGATTAPVADATTATVASAATAPVASATTAGSSDATTAPTAGMATPIAAPATTGRPFPARVPPTGGHHPPERHALACKVDADCTAKPHCRDTPCRCVKDTCIALRPAIDPVIDPAPVPPPET